MAVATTCPPRGKFSSLLLYPKSLKVGGTLSLRRWSDPRMNERMNIATKDRLLTDEALFELYFVRL